MAKKRKDMIAKGLYFTMFYLHVHTDSVPVVVQGYDRKCAQTKYYSPIVARRLVSAPALKIIKMNLPNNKKKATSIIIALVSTDVPLFA